MCDLVCSDVRKAFAARAAGLNASVSGAGDSDMNADAAGPVAESSPVESSAAGVVSGLGASLFPVGYGYVALTAIGSVIMVAWKSMKVGIARDECKVPYPQMYTSDNLAFNCVLRAHQNTMETYPQFLLLLMVGGLEMPYFCTLGGWIWIVGRITHAKGYYSGDPSKRAKGTISVIGLVMLAAATIKFAIKQIRS